jgi:small subunit ribosomal protein S24e
MDVEILKERDTPLLSRTRYTFGLSFKGATPTRKQIRDAIATKVKSDPSLTVVKHVYTRYGVEKAKVIAHTYSKKEDMIRFEDKGLLEKHTEKKKEPKEEKKEAPAAPAEEKKEEPKEAPKEEKKEEPKKEEKTEEKKE